MQIETQEETQTMAKKQKTNTGNQSETNQEEEHEETPELMTPEEAVSQPPHADDVYQVVFTGEMKMGEIISHEAPQIEEAASESLPQTEEVVPEPLPVVEEPAPVVETASVIEPGDGSPEHYLALGKQYLLANQHALAKTAYETALSMFNQANNQDGAAKCKEMLGTVSIMSADYGRALGYYQEALSHKKQMNDKAGMVELLQQLSMVSHLQGAVDMAREYNQQSRQLLTGEAQLT